MYLASLKINMLYVKIEIKSHYISKAKFVIQTSTNALMKQLGGSKSTPDYTNNETISTSFVCLHPYLWKMRSAPWNSSSLHSCTKRERMVIEVWDRHWEQLGKIIKI